MPCKFCKVLVVLAWMKAMGDVEHVKIRGDIV